MFIVFSPEGTYKSGRTPAPRWSPNEVSSHAFKKQLFYQYRYIKTLKAEKKKNPLEVSNSK